MASAEPLFETLEEIIRCAICLDVPTDPKVLPCMHMFCLDCLGQSHSTAVKDRNCPQDVVMCPECRQDAKIIDGRIEHFPTDYRTVQLAEALKTSRLVRIHEVQTIFINRSLNE